MAKAVVSRWKQSSLRRGREILDEGEEVKSQKRESDSGGIRRNTGLCERSKEYGI